jgi:hypothetical protein
MGRWWNAANEHPLRAARGARGAHGFRVFAAECERARGEGGATGDGRGLAAVLTARRAVFGG